jgi:integrase
MLPAEAPGADLTTGEYLQQWLGHAKGRVRATTYEGYEALVRCHAMAALGSVPLTSLHPLEVQRLYAELLEGLAPGTSGALSAKTVGNLHRVLRQALGQAVRWRLVEHNAAASAEPPRARRPELAVVDRDLAGRILDAATDTMFEAPVAIAVATGMRRGEILGLRWADVDQQTQVAHICRSLQPTAQGLVFEQPKTARSRRAIALPSFLLSYLQRQRHCQDRRRQDWAIGGASTAWWWITVTAHRGTPTGSPRPGQRSSGGTASPTCGSTTSATATPRSCWPRGSTPRSCPSAWATPPSASP